jgi:hypothetical protein
VRRCVSQGVIPFLRQILSNNTSVGGGYLTGVDAIDQQDKEAVVIVRVG